MNLKLNLLDPNLESDDFESHLFGCPDLPSSWIDDAIFNNDEVFLLQLNLQDLNIEGLPKEGMLSFFVATLSRPFRGIVRYNPNLKDCERIDFNCEIEGYNLNNEYTISNEGSDIEIFPEKVSFKEYRKLSNEICLLKLNLKDHPEIDLFKGIDEEICFMINKEDLNNKDFSKAHLSFNLE